MSPAEIVGARGDATPADRILDAAEDHLDGETAVLDASRVGGRRHLQAAADHARRVREAGRARCRDASMEVLLHAAGTDQIEAALERVGLTGSVDAVALVASGGKGVDAFLEAVGFERDEAVLEVAGDRARRLAGERGHPEHGDPVDWLVEDAARLAVT